ncbi:hypothetical protein [Lysinibacillus sphaericus]|uniref:Transposase n=1 Tax=Lysinibacillus sphaericus OT4b.31 TaxID=1285586 RepID=R7ZFE2_LYSSH|nr:hypothetical protein [Lysinibacillus sphaericus]EON70190.1 transposase [Lysinibacillus sphaericus OT4b.31]EON72756.1 transposase [Lysinibacillus sphaericus OT4b.31]
MVRILEVAIDFNFKAHRKIIERPMWAHHVEEADYLRHQSDMKQIYARRRLVHTVLGV